MTEHAPPHRDDRPEAALGRLRAVLDLSVALNDVPDVDDLLGAVLRTVTAVLECEQAAVLLYDDADGRAPGALRFAAATGDNRAALTRLVVPLVGSLAGTCYRENRAVFAADARSDERHFGRASGAADVAVRALLAVPMRIDGAPVGVLEALNPHREGFDAADAETLAVVSAQAAVAVRNARQQAALRAANRRLEALDRHRADFVTVASHELRTPLSVVSGYTQSLAGAVGPDHEEAVAEVLGAARRMASIVETLDELGSLREATGRASTDRVDLQSVLAGPTGTVVVESRRAVRVSLPDAPVWIAGDARRLRLAFGHLLANADAFTLPDGHVAVEAETSDGAVTVRVRDTGSGLAAGDHERIFEPFVQADAPDTRPHEGLGVGLALVRSVVLQHGGRVWATSAGRGRGSTFHVRLPTVPG